MSASLRIVFLQPRRESVEVKAGDAVSLGRAPDAQVRLEAAQVSSRHATIAGHEGRWMLIDQGSRNGTLLNGTLVAAQAPCELRQGDEITIHPFRFRVDLGAAGGSSTMVTVQADERAGQVRKIEDSEIETMAGRRLRLLIDSASMLQAAQDIPTLAQSATQALLQGTGFARALLLRGTEPAMEIVASAMREPSKDAPRLSRSLLRAAAEGKPVCLEDSNLNMAESIVGSGVTAALCIPLMIGESVEGFVYLDSVGGARPGEDAAAFATALARFVALGLGDHRRRELAQRQRALEEELSAAHDVQRRLMPEERGSLMGWRWRLHSEPGRFVAGDIVAAGEGPQGPWAFLGDVAGKGAAAGMLMASIQAHLASDLARGCPLVEAMNRVNDYVRKHRGGAEFATLFAVRLSADGRKFEAVDAGHGLAARVGAGQAAQQLQCEGGPPLGVADFPYESSTFDLAPSERIVLFSDGVNEQRSAAGQELGIERVLATLQHAGDVEIDVEGLIGTLRGHAAGIPYADDVSVIGLSFEGLSDATRA
ncbi:MAG: SpoIIE family protein phosphatase [Phycisphaerales bacterium]